MQAINREEAERGKVVELKSYIAGQFARLSNKPSDLDKDGKVLKELMRELKVVYPKVIEQLNWNASQKRNFEEASKLEGTSGVVNSSGQYTKKYIAAEQERVLRAIEDLKKYLDQNFKPDDQPN